MNKLKPMSPEKEALEKIKLVLKDNNEAIAIRIIEDYGFWRCLYEKKKVENEK